MRIQKDNLETEGQHQIVGANKLRRLINFLVDTFIWFILYVAIAYFLDQFVSFSSYSVNYIYSISLGIIVFYLYHVLFEYYFQKSLGKLITRTKVVSSSNEKLNFKTLSIRSLSRLIPIDFFYLLFTKKTLHDQLVVEYDSD